MASRVLKQIAKRRGGSVEGQQTVLFVFRQAIAPNEIEDAPHMFTFEWAVRVVHHKSSCCFTLGCHRKRRRKMRSSRNSAAPDRPKPHGFHTIPRQSNCCNLEACIHAISIIY
jgi:hypothetical protein